MNQNRIYVLVIAIVLFVTFVSLACDGGSYTCQSGDTICQTAQLREQGQQLIAKGLLSQSDLEAWVVAQVRATCTKSNGVDCDTMGN